jgi:hypothetical protein
MQDQYKLLIKAIAKLDMYKTTEEKMKYFEYVIKQAKDLLKKDII